MAFSFTADDLITSIKKRGRVPTSQTTFTNANLLTLADQELEVGLLPQIMKNREDYYLHETDIDVVSGKSQYRIPKRAIGGKVKSVCLVESNGDENPLEKIDYENRIYYTNAANPVFYIKNNSIVIVPEPDTTLAAQTLRVSYFIRPSSLVLESSAATITAINTNTNEVTVSAVPSTITASTPIDFVRSDGGFECLDIDVTPTGLTSTTFTFSSLPTDLEVGDYICLAGETPIPQIPAELHTVLALRVTVTVLASLGFINEMKAVQKKLEEAEEAVGHLISPRVDSNAKKIINRRSLLNSRRHY
jgi:hypothetical protein